MAVDGLNLNALIRHTPDEVDVTAAQAAVLLPVVRRSSNPHLLFTKRAEHLGEHPGQMSFPGGGREEHDDDLQETAIRECQEEIGLQPGEIDFHGRLDDIRTITEYVVTPFVGSIPDRRYHPDEQEVAEVVPLAVRALTDAENYEAEVRDHPDVGEITIHYFHVDGYTVWGATARILAQFLTLTTGWHPPDEPPTHDPP